MDLDLITTKSLKEDIFWNVFVSQDEQETMLSSSIFHLQRRHSLIDTIIQRFIDSFEPDSYIGRSLIIPDLLIDLCVGSFATRDLTFTQCENATILPHNYFYPIPYWSWQQLFKNITNEDLITLMGNDNYGFNIWNTLSQKEPLLIGTTQMYVVLAAQHCPVTVSVHGLFSNTDL